MDGDRPVGTTIMKSLEEALTLETKYQPHLKLPQVCNDNTEITAGIRDGSAHVLRCLKVWYDLPQDVLFVAINLVDRFLTKMKVRPKHMACISIASFQLASRTVSSVLPLEVPEPRDLAVISQCKCTLGDLSRMEGIISSKLSSPEMPVTSLTFIRLFDRILSASAEHCGITDLYTRVISMSTLCLQLEILVCDVSCSNFRHSELAWVLLCTQLDLSIAQFPELSLLITFADEFQKLCKITNESFCTCQQAVLNVLNRYNGQSQMPYRQRLVWRLSQRTMRLLRPTNKLILTLPPIDENGLFNLPLRSRSGSVSSEEESWEEWPCINMQTVSEEVEEEEDSDNPPSTFHCDMA